MPKIEPFVSRGEPVLRSDGTLEMVPVQLIDAGDGRSIFRVGDTTFWFTKEGTYDGTEHAFRRRLSDDEIKRVEEMLRQAPKNRGLPPDIPYFEPGAKGFANEVQGWSEATPEADPAQN